MQQFQFRKCWQDASEDFGRSHGTRPVDLIEATTRSEMISSGGRNS
ncbi:MAG: hypothetical protein WD069_04345 [Planctomycetales bacterium]